MAGGQDSHRASGFLMAAESPDVPDATADDSEAASESPLTQTPGSEAPDETHGESFQPPPAQPLRMILALALIAAGAALYGFVLTSFWSSPSLGIHQRFPYPAYALIVLALLMALAGLRLSLGIWSPHAKLGIGLFGFLTCAALGIGGGRFASYTLRGTLNPAFTLTLAQGDRFPDFALADQNGAVHTLRDATIAPLTLIVVYRGDFCPFSRFAIAELAAHARELDSGGIRVVAISTDATDRSSKLAAFLNTDIPLLSDRAESLLGPLGLIERHRNREPDNSIPAYFLVDRNAIVRWVFTSPYYRQLPTVEMMLETAASIRNAR